MTATARLNFSVKLEVPLQAASPEFCWFHPRAVAIPSAANGGIPSVLMTIQKHLEADDFYSGLYTMRTDDLGQNWSGPTEVPELAWRIAADGVITSVADVTPGYHPETGKVIAIGAEVRYSQSGEQLETAPRSRQCAYAIYDPGADRWSGWQTIELPPDTKFDFACSACSQWLAEPDGAMLIPFYHATDVHSAFSATVFRCAFDGKTITVLDVGDTLELNVQRGLAEPSLIKFGGRYFLTLRNDVKGYVAASDDGLHYEPMTPWLFDDGTELGSYNTQQHWLAHSEGLFLCYTRRSANNDHIPRSRAPLFIAQVDPDRLCVLRDTEQVLMPERGLMLGNFGAAPITPTESWVTDSEYLCYNDGNVPTQAGGNGSTFVARVVWERPSS